MPYNRILSRPSVTATTPITEPLTLAELKKQCRVSPTQTADDDIITAFGVVARQTVERWTGCALVASTVIVELKNECGNIDLPFGPVTGAVTLVNSDNDSIDDPDIRGIDFKYVVSPRSCYLKATYTAGYSAATRPVPLTRAIGMLTAWLYEHRGDEIGDYGTQAAHCPAAYALCAPYIQMSPIV